MTIESDTELNPAGEDHRYEAMLFWRYRGHSDGVSVEDEKLFDKPSELMTIVDNLKEDLRRRFPEQQRFHIQVNVWDDKTQEYTLLNKLSHIKEWSRTGETPKELKERRQRISQLKEDL